MNRHTLLEQRYGLQFPESFYAFYEFACAHAELLEFLGRGLMGMSLAGSDLMGPFEFLKTPNLPQGNPIQDARYYNDPPEFLTIAFGRTDGLHWGYYVDDPQSPTFPVVSYYSNDAFELDVVGDTLFEAARDEVESHHNGCLEMVDYDPDAKDTYERRLDQLALLRQALQTHETGERTEVGEDYLTKYHPRNGISRQVIAPTRDGMGIVVPEGKYRPLSGDDAFQIWNYHPTPQEAQERAEKAMELLTQGYPGAALKLGKDLWIYQEHRETSYALLDAAYAALGREWLRERLSEAITYRQECDAKRES